MYRRRERAGPGSERKHRQPPFLGQAGVSALRFIAFDMFVNIYYLSLCAALTDIFFSLIMALDLEKTKRNMRISITRGKCSQVCEPGGGEIKFKRHAAEDS